MLVLVVDGEVDFGTSPELRSALEPLEGSVVVDLGETTFMDSSGLQVLLTATVDPKRRLHIACPPIGPVTDLLRVAGVGDWFKLYENRRGAIAAFAASAADA